MKISLDDIDNIALGSTFFGTGGGGDPLLGTLAAKHALVNHGEVDLINAEDIDDDSVVAAVGGIGAPSVAIEKLMSEASFDVAIRELENHIGKKLDAIIPFEMGGGNSLIPLVAAARRALPLINADGMGRAFPESQMMTFCIYGVPTCPATVVDEFGDFAVIQARSEPAQEKLSRALALSMGGIAMSASNVMTGKMVRSVSILGTYELAARVGRLLKEYRGQLESFIEELRPLV